METTELKILNVLFEKLHLTDEEKINFTEDFEKARENSLKSSMGEFKSMFKEEFHRLELKMEQNKSDIDLKLKDIELKLKDLELKIEKSNTISIRWFISLFVAVVLMILGLYFKR